MNPNRIWVLVKGELLRLNKYNVFAISVLVAIMWGAILFFLDNNALVMVLPLVLIVDSTMMSIMYIGSVMFFEKTESTISTMLVTPASNGELVLSKVLANTVHNLFSSVLIIIVFVLVKDVQIHWALILLGIILATTFHTILGLFMAYYQKNFTNMLVNIMIFAFVLMAPSILYELNIIHGEWIKYVMLINPIQAGAEVISGGFADYTYPWQYYYSLGYLAIGMVLIYRFLVLPKFQDYAVKQSGV